MLNETTKTFLTIHRHRTFVRLALGTIVDNLNRRAEAHDLSKFEEDEFYGLVGINETAREYPYGSEQYRASLQVASADGGCLNKHYSRNSHHPEFHDNTEDMSFLDIIEMVCDWYSASKTYGQSSFVDAIPTHFKRFSFSSGQKWLILQVADCLQERQEKTP